MYYTFKSRVRYSECDQSGQLSLVNMINYFQDCSVFQSEYVGQGVEKLEEEGKVWVLSSWKLEIDHFPMLGDEIEIGTFAIRFRGFYGFRNFFMKDAGGNYLVKVYSIWTFLDRQTGHPTKVQPEEVEAYGVEPELSMKDKSRKIPAPALDASVEEKAPAAVLSYHLDTNHHVNNGRYVEIASAYLPDDFQVGSMHVSYKKAAVKGDMLYPVVFGMKDRYQVALRNQQGEDYCVCEFCRKEDAPVSEAGS